jgi:arylsulfatase A-like enzyme
MKSVAMLFAMFLAVVSAVPAADKPNFVIILADDMGYGDPGYHGGDSKTPALDRLAAEGVKLEAHYVHPMCSPTRTALLSGRYGSRFGVTAAQNEQAMPFGTETVASLLRGAGYETALIGKWHLGSAMDQIPNKFGFDYSYGCMAGGCTPDTHEYKRGPFQKTWHRNDQLIEEPGHVTDLITHEAVQWIEQRGTKPFFLYVPFTAVHLPIAEPQKWMEANPQITDPAHRVYAADVSHLDDCVNQIVQALEKKGVRDNTMVVFLSDNGAHQLSSNRAQTYPGADHFPDYDLGGSNKPLRGYKTQVYEGGIRTPGIVHWPSRWKPATLQVPLSITDWLPTLCAMAGVTPSASLQLDGKDISPLLAGAVSPEKFEPHPIYSASPAYKARMVRKGPWKLVVTEAKTNPKKGKVGTTPGRELFHIADDIGESHDLFAQEPKIAAELGALLETFMKDDQPSKKGASEDVK